jgi:hypothetical protein
MAKKKTGRQWTWAPSRMLKPKVPDDLKKEVQKKADDWVAKVLAPKYIKPPPKKPRWNYPVELWTKWHRSFFYFGSTWASPGPNRIAPTFEVRFARLEYVGDRRFNLAYYRHTEEWWNVYKGQTLGECLRFVEDGGPFSLTGDQPP